MKKTKCIARLNPLFLEGIAHRGLHDETKTENGLAAFQNAIDHRVAFELDVHLTKDGVLVVCHDSELKRVTGKEGIIEHLTLEEIKTNYRLLDGETIPTFQEVLALNHEQVPMVIELKVYEKNYAPLAKRLSEALKEVKDKKNYLLISFDPRALWKMKKQGFIRQLLVTTTAEWTYCFRHTVESLDLEDKMLEEKRVRRYQKKHLVNVWTIETEAQLKKVAPYCDTVTFQYLDPNLVRKTLTKANQ